MGSLTNALKELKDVGSAETLLCKHFFEIARTYARSLVSTQLQNRVTPTSVANKALSEAIRNARMTRATLQSGEFEALLIKIVQRRVVDASRRIGTQKRDASRETQGKATANLVANGCSPSEEAAVNEIAKEVTEIIMSDVDETVRLIKYLHFIDGRDCTDIAKLLAAQGRVAGGERRRVPQLRTIQVTVKAFLEELRRHFRAE